MVGLRRGSRDDDPVGDLVPASLDVVNARVRMVSHPNMRRAVGSLLSIVFITACARPPVATSSPVPSANVKKPVAPPIASVDPRDETSWCWDPLPALPGDDDDGTLLQRLSVVSHGDELWVGWSTQSGHVARWRSGTWENAAVDGMYPLLATNSAGDAFAVFEANSNKQAQLQIVKRTKWAWTSLGTIEAYPDPFTNADAEDIQVDAEGNPILVWTESTPGGGGGGLRTLHVARRIGGKWIMLGDSLDGGAEEARLALDHDDNPWVAWLRGRGPGAEARVARWNGQTFVDATPTFDKTKELFSMSFTIGDRGRAPTLSLWEIVDKRPGKHAVFEWREGGWTRHDPPGAGDISVRYFEGGDLVGAWSDEAGDPGLGTTPSKSITVARLNADGWRTMLRGVNLARGDTSTRVVALAPHGEGAFLVWDEAGNDNRRIRAIDVRPCRTGESARAFEESGPPIAVWPKTVDEAVNTLEKDMIPADTLDQIRAMPRSDLIKLHFGLGMYIRNKLGLWRGNDALLKSCGDVDPEDCSMQIIERLWDRLQKTRSAPKPEAQ